MQDKKTKPDKFESLCLDAQREGNYEQISEKYH